MPAPFLEPSTSISSSGHTDGLGRRALHFDRETGAILERLHVRPELAAFEVAIRERVASLAEFEDPRFAKSCSAERDESGNLTVVSEFVAGTRLSDLLDLARDEGLVPGIDAALGYLVEALAAVATLHATAGFPHGLISPGRTVITDGGQVVFLDAPYAAVVDRLGLSSRRLWVDFGVAAARGTGHPRLDQQGDLNQVALSAVMLALGCPMEDEDCQDALPAVLMKVVDIAQVRGSAAFAAGLQRTLQRMLPLPGRRPYGSADEALRDVRQLMRREMGVDACRHALAAVVCQFHVLEPGSETSAPAPAWIGAEDDEAADADAAGGPARDPMEFDLSFDDKDDEAEAAVQDPTFSAEGAPGGLTRRHRRPAAAAGGPRDPLRPASAPGTPAAPALSSAGGQPPSRFGWLVPLERAAQFDHGYDTTEPETPGPQVDPAPPIVPHRALVPQPSSVRPASPAKDAGAPGADASAPGSAAQTSPGGRPAPAGLVPAPVAVKIQNRPPEGYVPALKPRRRRADPIEPLEPVSILRGDSDATPEDVPEPKAFPRKLAAAAIVLVGTGIIAGRMYLPSATVRPTAAASGAQATSPAPPTAAEAAAQPAGTGQIAVTTEPGGAIVLLDGRPAGKSPVTLAAVPAGRHVLTFESSSGSVTRTVRVVAGKVQSVDVPTFSGWVSMLAPLVMDVSENGTPLGTTQQERLMLPPGRHSLTVRHGELGYTAVHDVHVSAGEVTTIRIDPTSPTNLNAMPWAEVWIDGQKIGDTPIANYALRLGNRDIVFRHPQLGERRVSALVRAGQSSAIAVDFTKPQAP